MYPKPRFSGKRLAVLGVLAALSLAVHTIESAFPPLFGIPGAKLGLSNLFSMLALVVYGPLDAFCILLARTLLGALIGGSASSLLFSLSGGGAALLVSILLIYFAVPRVSYLAVNIAAAVIHNIVQVAVLCGRLPRLQTSPFFPTLPSSACFRVLPSRRSGCCYSSASPNASFMVYCKGTV